MANSDKNILITPQIGAGTGTYPEIAFTGSGNNPIRLRVLDDNTVEFKISENLVDYDAAIEFMNSHVNKMKKNQGDNKLTEPYNSKSAPKMTTSEMGDLVWG